MSLLERCHPPPRLAKLKFDWFNDTVKSIKAMRARIKSRKH